MSGKEICVDYFEQPNRFETVRFVFRVSRLAVNRLELRQQIGVLRANANIYMLGQDPKLQYAQAYQCQLQTLTINLSS